MNKRFLHSIVIGVSALFLAACGGKGKSEPEASFTVTPTSAEVIALGENKSFTILSSSDWYARSSVAWIKMATASGKGSSTQASTLTVSVEENKETAERTGVVTVSTLDGKKAEITLKQAAGGGSIKRGIGSAEDLLGFARAVNGEEGYSINQYLIDGEVKFTADIDASSIKEWVPIGTASSPLKHNVDGSRYTIKNIAWTVDLDKYPDAGLFGCVNGATIRRLTVGDDGSKVSFKGTPSGNVAVGGIVGRAIGVTLEGVTNNVSLTLDGSFSVGNNVFVGGLAGRTDASCLLGGDTAAKGCTNNGDISVKTACREGGLVGYNMGTVNRCANRGAILGPYSSDRKLGPGWGCSYNQTAENFIGNAGYGFVGDREHPAMLVNAVVEPLNNFNLYDDDSVNPGLNNTVDWTLDAYYDWTVVESRELASGAVYTKYSFTNVPRTMHVLEVDLKNAQVEVVGSLAGDMIPNPNGNGNNNNGFKLRERLSDVCARRRAAGEKILYGVNACFFDSNDGISRGFHVENGEPVYINNPSVVKQLSNHQWGFAVYADGTAASGKKQFTGKVKTAAKEYNFYSVNDTTLRHASPTVAPINLYTKYYVQTPYASTPALTNPLAPNVLYVICEYTGSPMKVNAGYAQARVISIHDGRFTNVTPPYITSASRVGIALSGTPAGEWADAVKVGDTIELSCTISIDGDSSKPMLMLDSTMYEIMVDGEDRTASIPAGAAPLVKYDPMTFPVVSADGSKLWLVEIDGRKGWKGMGVKAYEMFRIGKKLGGANISRLDGGGSSAVWLWDGSQGAVVSQPCDSKGERSCLSYILIREK